MLTHACVHIFTLHMCVHFASEAQMVTFKAAGVLKWWRHYEESRYTSTTINVIDTRCTVLQRSSFETATRWTTFSFYLPQWHVHSTATPFHHSFKPLNLWNPKFGAEQFNSHSTFHYYLVSTEHNKAQCRTTVNHFAPSFCPPLLFICQHKGRFYAV